MFFPIFWIIFKNTPYIDHLRVTGSEHVYINLRALHFAHVISCCSGNISQNSLVPEYLFDKVLDLQFAVLLKRGFNTDAFPLIVSIFSAYILLDHLRVKGTYFVGSPKVESFQISDYLTRNYFKNLISSNMLFMFAKI